jgi:ribonuclease III
MTTPASEPPTKIFNPWNPVNKIIPDAEIRRILKRYGVHQPIKRPELFREACVHKSYVDRHDLWEEQAAEGEVMVMAERPANCLPLQEADNEEKEFAGDSVLGCIVALYLKRRYAGKGEGFLTRLRTRIVNNKQLGHLAKKMGLKPWIIVSRHVEEVCAGGRENLRLLGSLLEAWVYALYEHFDENGKNPGLAFSITQTFVINIIESHIDFVDLINDDTNFKDQLLRWFQAQYHQPPRYKEVEVVGPPHDRIFTMGVLSPDDTVIATSTARNKKVAEQEASRLALIALGVSLTS